MKSVHDEGHGQMIHPDNPKSIARMINMYLWDDGKITIMDMCLTAGQRHVIKFIIGILQILHGKFAIAGIGHIQLGQGINFGNNLLYHQMRMRRRP